MSNTIKTKEITMKELSQAFQSKYVNVSSMDHYGISIEMHKGTIEYEDNLMPELYFVSRDDENRVTGSVCVSEDAIESIEEYDNGTYTIRFSIGMADIDISEYKPLEELRKDSGEN